MEPNAYTRLDALERSNCQLRTLLLGSILVLPLLAALAFTSFGHLQRNNPIVADSLLVRQLRGSSDPRLRSMSCRGKLASCCVPPNKRLKLAAPRFFVVVFCL